MTGDYLYGDGVSVLNYALTGTMVNGGAQALSMTVKTYTGTRGTGRGFEANDALGGGVGATAPPHTRRSAPSRPCAATASPR